MALRDACAGRGPPVTPAAWLVLLAMVRAYAMEWDEMKRAAIDV